MDVAQACSRGPSCSDLVRATGRCGRRLGADQRAGVDRTRCPGCPCGRDNSGDLPATTRCWASARPGVHTVRRRRSVECSGCRRSTGYDCARPVHCRPGAGCRRIWADPAADQPQHLPDTEDPDVEGLLSSGQVDANRLVMRPGFACVVVPEPAPRLRHTVLSTTPLARRCDVVAGCADPNVWLGRCPRSGRDHHRARQCGRGQGECACQDAQQVRMKGQVALLAVGAR